MLKQFCDWAGVPLEQLQGWEAVPLLVDGDVAGVAAIKGVEIHFALAPEWRRRAITRRRAREFLQPLLSRRGYLVTRSFGQRSAFAERLGFKPGHTYTVAGAPMHTYTLMRLPFSRKE